MSSKYSPAPEVAKIAQDLIPQHHSSLHQYQPRIEYVFINKTPKQKGKDIWGTMRKVDSLPAYLAASEDEQNDGETTPFFVLTISKPIWDLLGEDKRIALVDHELCHGFCEEDDDGAVKLGIIPHDLEEFACIVKRHGMWTEDVKEFLEVANKGAK